MTNLTAPESKKIYLLLWIVASCIAIFFAMQLDSAAFVDGKYIPVSNDSFYHARRILDAALSERGFYQFDVMIHAPEGSWLTWPWAYNYLAAKALSFALWLRPSMEPMAFVAHIPVAWIPVNFGLLTLIGIQIRLSIGMLAVALLGFAMMPLVQNLHGLGFIDHHFLEFTFVLATILTGLRFFSAECSRRDAIALGVVLGLAPAFHNGLFILQLPVLVTMFALWLRNNTPDYSVALPASISLVVTTLLIALPSEPFRELQFEFWTLSWFHLYIAVSSAISLFFLGWRSYSPRNLVILMGIGAVLLIPLITKIVSGSAFLAGDLILLDQISEVKSPLNSILTLDGARWAAASYSYLFFLSPVLLMVFTWWAVTRRDASSTFFAVFAVFGMGLMLTQFRLHPFGSWVLIFGSLLLFDRWQRDNDEVSPLAATGAVLLVLAFAFQPPLKEKLFQSYPPGLTKDYAATRTLFPSLAKECAAEPGIVLSYNDDGHYVRYHTDCSVITNNFLMTPFHEKKILQADAMLQSTPEDFLNAEPQIDYVFVRMYEIFEEGPDGVKPVPLQEVVNRNAPLFVALTFGENLPPNFKLIDEVRVNDPRDFAYARVYKIVRD